MIRKSILIVCLGLLATSAVYADNKEQKRLENSGVVMQEIMNIPDSIPHEVMEKAECVIVFPSVLKAAFVVGASYGRGAMVCRSGKEFQGPWGAPAMMALEGGSVGFQIGGQATDLVLLIMNDRGAQSILSSKVKLGGDASVAAGPVGRDAAASTDAFMRAEILSYSRTRGVSLECRWKVPRCVRTMAPTRMCMAANSPPGKSCLAEWLGFLLPAVTWFGY